APGRSGRTLTTWFIPAARPRSRPRSVVVPEVPGRGTTATEPESTPLASRAVPLGLLNVFSLSVAVGPGALTSSAAPVAPGTPRTFQVTRNEPSNGMSRLWPAGA